MTGVMGQTKSAVIAAIVAAALYFSGIFTLLAPLPMLYASVVKGRAAGLASALIAAAGVVAVYAFLLPAGAGAGGGISYLLIPGQGFAGHLPLELIKIGGIGYFAFFVAIAISLAWGAHRRWGLMKWSGISLLSGLAVMAAVAAIAWSFGPQEIVAGVRSYTSLAFAEIAKAGVASGDGASQIAFLADNADEVSGYFIRLMPSLAFAFVVIAVAINLVVGRRMIRGHHAFSHVHNVARFRLPDALIWGVIVSGAAFFIDSYVVKLGWLRIVALNGLIGFGVLYFLQGMAVIVYFLQGIRMPLIRTLAYVAMIIFLQTVSLGLLLVGVADVWANFRLRRWRTLHHHS